MSNVVTDFSAAEAKVLEAERLGKAAEASQDSFSGRLSGASRERQREYDRAVVAALLELLRACQTAIRAQEARLAQVEQQAGALLAHSERLHELQEQFAQGGQNAQMSREGVERLQNELRERLQHIVDEQRVALRQLALQSSEEAVLADRARRGTEARLDSLEERVQKLASDQSTP
jgi:hypothetical protein